MSLEKPRFRRDLEASPVSADGQSYVEVRDAATGRSFLFYDFEYQVALAFDGLPLEKVIPWVKLATGLALEVAQLREFAQRLDELGFIEADPEVPNSEEAQATTVLPGVAAPGSPPQGAAPPGPPPLPLAAPQPPPSAPEPPAPSLSPSLPESSLPEAEDDLPGPPEPDAVVMHPSEVVGETPPPVSASEAVSVAPLVGPPLPSATVAEVAPQDLPATSPELAGDSVVPTVASEPGEAAPYAIDESERIAEAIMRKALPPPARSLDEVAASTPDPVLAPAPADVALPPGARWPAPPPGAVPPVFPGSVSSHGAFARRRIRRSLLRFGTLGVLAAAALLAITLPFVFSSRQPSAVDVRTVSVTPGTVYRYFEGAAPIVPLPGPVLKFPVGGKVIRVLGRGSTVAPGDVVAAVEAARPLLNRLAKQRERLAYTRQMAETMHQVDNGKEEERQAARAEAQGAMLAATLRELANLAVVAMAAGQVDQPLAQEGQLVQAESPAVRLRSPGFRASFALARAHLELARRLGFCQVEVEGYLLDCTPTQAASDEAQVTVELAAVPPALEGKPAHLARARYSSAVVLPAAALQGSEARTSVLVVSKNARLEERPVVVADRDDVEAIVVQGLDPGDKVVAAPTPRLRPGMAVTSRGG